MRQRTSLLVLLAHATLVAHVAAAPARSELPFWRVIEHRMREDGCFTAPLATLRDALRSASQSCRWRAAWVLGLQGEREAIPDLRTVQERDPDASTRTKAALALVQLGELGYLELLRGQLEGNASLREKVALAGDLSSVGDATGWRYLVEACHSIQLEDRQACSWNRLSFEPLAKKDLEWRDAVTDLMLRLAEDTNAGLRQDGFVSLRGLAREMALPERVLDRLKELAAVSPDQEVRRQAQMTLDQQRERERPPNRLVEIGQLGILGDKNAIPELKRIFGSDPDPEARLQAAKSLVRLGERGYLDFVRKALEETPRDRLYVASQLALLGDSSGYRYVEEACRSSEPMARRSAANALVDFARLAEHDEHLLASLLGQSLDLAEDSDLQVRQIVMPRLEIYSRVWILPGPAIARLEKLAASAVYPEVKSMARAAVEEQKRKKLNPTKQEP